MAENTMSQPERPSETVRLFGLDIWSGGYESAVSSLGSVIWGKSNLARIVVTPNVDHIVRVDKNRELFAMYSRADFCFPDGFPIVLAGKLLGKKIIERVVGADLFPLLCKLLAKRNGKVFILGGEPGTEAQIEETLSKKYMGLQVLSCSPPFGFSAESQEARIAAERINEWQPHVVFVCLGMPKQEIWAFRYREKLNTKLILCVGAALDFDLGLSKRAPKWVQKTGLEWFWRLCSNPRRLWRRYLIDDLAFLKIFCREAISERRRRPVSKIT